MNDSVVRGIAASEAQKAVLMGLPVTELQTDDATPVIITTVELDDYTAGMIEVEIVAMNLDGTGKMSGKSIFGLFKDSTLTIDTPDPLHNQDGIGVTWDLVNDSDNAAVEITGIAATSILWQVKVKTFLMTIIPTAP